MKIKQVNLVGKVGAAKVAEREHWLSELTERVDREARREAMTNYLDGAIHQQMMVGSAMIDKCEESWRKLLKGEIAPWLDICCCGDTFAAILSSVTRISYKACELPTVSDFDENDEEIADSVRSEDMPLNDAKFAKLSKLSSPRLCERLIADYDCEPTEYYCLHKEDSKVQRQYYEAVLKRFEAAAQYAKAIGSESARLWLEALCYLQPRVNLKFDGHESRGLDLVEGAAASAYETAERAQRMLWIDEALRKLPSAKLPAKNRKSRR